MASFKKRYDAKKKKDALTLLSSLKQKILEGEMEIKTFGYWQGVEGTWTFKIVTKETENLRLSSQF